MTQTIDITPREVRPGDVIVAVRKSPTRRLPIVSVLGYDEVTGSQRIHVWDEVSAAAGHPPVITRCDCGWEGVPTYIGGVPQDQCPACAGRRHDEFFRSLPVHHASRGHAPIRTRASEKVDRNGPCPCGSGRKAKKCCH